MLGITAISLQGTKRYQVDCGFHNNNEWRRTPQFALPVEKHQLFRANAVPTVSVSAPDASGLPLGLILMTLSSLTSEEQPSTERTGRRENS